jgi:hypothetical protein
LIPLLKFASTYVDAGEGDNCDSNSPN